MALSWSKFGFHLRLGLRQIWVRVTAFAVLGLLTAAVGWLLKDAIPADLMVRIGADAVVTILQILAASMLTVTTFSLSILTAAYAIAGGNSSPRAVILLVEDGISQTVLATFIGAFVFSLVGIIMLETGLYGQGGRLILFAVTLMVVLIVVGLLLRWIARLGQLGRVDDSLGRVETAAHAALAERLAQPWLGGSRLIGAPPADAQAIACDRIGFLRHCDIGQLHEQARTGGLQIYLAANTGDFVHTAAPLMHVLPWPAAATAQAALKKSLMSAFTVENGRDFDQNPRHGLRVLSEIGQRALSPGINDPGTAELALAAMVRVLGQWDAPASPAVRYPRVWVPPLETGEMLDIAFTGIARDGAGNIQVQMALQSALLALSRIAPRVFAARALELSRLALDHAEAGMVVARQRAPLHRLSGRIADIAAAAQDRAADADGTQTGDSAENL